MCANILTRSPPERPRSEVEPILIASSALRLFTSVFDSLVLLRRSRDNSGSDHKCIVRLSLDNGHHSSKMDNCRNFKTGEGSDHITRIHRKLLGQKVKFTTRACGDPALSTPWVKKGDTFIFMKNQFLTRDAMRKRGLCCRPVSVCLSVTFVYCIQVAKDIVKLLYRTVAPLL